MLRTHLLHEIYTSAQPNYRKGCVLLSHLEKACNASLQRYMHMWRYASISGASSPIASASPSGVLRCCRWGGISCRRSRSEAEPLPSPLCSRNSPPPTRSVPFPAS